MFIFLMKIRTSKFFVQNIFHNPMLNAYLQHSNRATFSNKYCHNLTHWFSFQWIVYGRHIILSSYCCQLIWFYYLIIFLFLLVQQIFCRTYIIRLVWYTINFARISTRPIKKSIKTFYDIWTSNMQANQRNPLKKTRIRLF